MGIGCAFAGGGLKGVSYIGVLKALEEIGVEIDYISGTSSGSIFAVMYSMGYGFDDIKDMFTSCYEKIIKIKKMPIVMDSAKFVFTKKFELSGVIAGETLEELVESYAKKRNFNSMNDIKKNMAIITVDAKSTKECVLWTKEEMSDGNMDYISDIPVGKAVRASMAFPAAFTPCKFRDYIFIDGGTKDNLPVSVLKKMGAEKTIGFSFALDEYKEDSNLFDTILRACDIFSYRDVLKAQGESDLAIEIKIPSAKLLSIDSVDEAIKIGYDTVIENKDSILKLIEKTIV